MWDYSFHMIVMIIQIRKWLWRSRRSYGNTNFLFGDNVTIMEKETRSLSLVSIELSPSLQLPPSSKSLIAWLRWSWRSIVPTWSLQSPQLVWLNASSQMMAVFFSLQLLLIVSLPTLESIKSLFKIACYLSVLLPFEVSFTPYPVIISLYFDLVSCGNIANSS